MTTATTPYRSSLPVGRDSFGQLLRAEWTKFRTVRGWVITAFAAALLIVLFAYLGTFAHHDGGICIGPNAASGTCRSFSHPIPPLGPGGEPVADTYYSVSRTLVGNGTITVRVSSLTGLIQDGNGHSASVADMSGAPGPVQPWAKAGLIVSAGSKLGSAYAAVMLTGTHGVRLQYDYADDIAGPRASATAPRWLRLTRSGRTLKGYESADGSSWTMVGTASLPALPTKVQAGMFVTSPPSAQAQPLAGGAGSQATGASATFGQPALAGGWSPGGWTARDVGDTHVIPTVSSVGSQPSGSGFAITGSGDLGPSVGVGDTDKNALTGVFIGLIVLIVLGVMFITGEYRRGLIQTTFTATPRRGRVLIAKAIVIAAVAFVVGAAASAVSIPLGSHILQHNGNYVYPTSTLTELRLILGTGLLVALVAVLALAVGTSLRRGAGAVTAVIALIILPYVLAFASALPTGASEWLLRITPAAAFAVQQTVSQYHQVSWVYTPSDGYYPLSPAVGLAVLGAYTLAALLIANRVLRTRDA